MLKKLILSLIIFIFFSTCRLAYASLLINEVMYDPLGSDTGREWVEIKNDTSSPIDISGYKFLESAGASNHGLTLIQGVASIPASGFAVISNDTTKFLLDYPNFSGNLFKVSVTSFNNSGNTLTLKDSSLSVLDNFNYTSSMGANDDGNSLQKISGSWSGASPTPGIVNEIIVAPVAPPPPSSDGNNSNDNTSTTTGGNGEDPYLKNKKEQKIQTKIFAKNVVFSGVPVDLKAISTDSYGDVLPYGKYYWNFGDGDSRQVSVNETEKFTHIYFYPGEYSINLEYYMNYYGENPDAIDKFTIKVLAPQIVISSVGDDKDFYIEITNNGDYEADISKWVLVSENRDFILPKNTILGSKKKIIISPHISLFNMQDKNTLKLTTPQREVVFDYFASITPVKIISPVIVKEKIKENSSFTNKQVKNEKIDSIDLSAAPILAVKDQNNSRVYVFGGILVIFLGTTSALVYFLRKKRSFSLAGDDFELIDE